MSRRTPYRYHVKAWYSWADVGAGRAAIDQGYQSRDEAMAAARASDCPLIDVSERGQGVIADREMLRHPQMSEVWVPRDTIDR